MLCLVRLLGDGNRQLAQQRALRQDVIHLVCERPCSRSRLPLRALCGLQFLLLVLAFQQGLAGDHPVGGNLLQTVDFPLDHIQFFRRLQELRLGFDDLLVGQAEIEERLAGSHRLAL